MLTIAYVTGRQDPKIEWFFSSLHRETKGDYTGIDIVVVDFHADERCPSAFDLWPYNDGNGSLRVIPPKPNVWQGKHRLTKDNWFSASNSRNSALCMARDGHIAYVDDLSVLHTGWLTYVREAMGRGTVTAGSYQKLRDMVVASDGGLVSCTDFIGGRDNRRAHITDLNRVYSCGGNWLYGCSLVSPVEALLEINGWPEIADGLGFEDCLTGIMLSKKGWEIEYDPRMMTYESEELHHVGPTMKRSDYGVSPNDKSHALLKMAQQGDGWHPGFYGPGGIRELRQRVLAGEPFPIVQIPENEFFTGKLLRDL